ncbi:MAG: type II toxin-antitoxin system prevent-host-death family antitoxin [Thermomicrobiales bacterium]
MPKTVSTVVAKNQFSAMIGWAEENRDEVIVESHGRPRAAIVSFSEYEEMRLAREQTRRQDALRRLRELRARVRARNQDLTDEEADALAARFVREVIDDMAAEGILKFERDRLPEHDS